ncbi:hypothetical protein [Pseudonocardia sp. NPDC049154]|uniref:hypothetical protein n=1 Tax=Pseudonocardia sp. NPDC049154 TaxID=3155501 RepID=UPI0033EBC8B5
MGFALNRSADRVEKEQTVQEQAQTIREVGDPLLRLCETDPSVRARVGSACDTAAQAVSAAAEPVRDGTDGKAGVDGRGIVGTEVRDDGHLVLTYSDGAVEDVGLVVGTDGTAGASGTGIVSAATVDGHLVLTFTDGSTVDVGQIVGATGAAGRGVTSTAAVGGRLIVTYSDGAVEDAGPLPTSPPAPPAAQLVINRTDGTTVTCDRTGGDDTAPVYTCTA